LPTERVFHRVNVESMYTPDAKKRVLVAWSLVPGCTLQEPVTYELQTAKSANADTWTPVARTVDQLFAYDKAPELKPHEFSLFYRIVATDVNGVTSTSQSANYYMNLDPYGWRLMRQYIRLQLLGQRKRGGTPAWLLKRRITGPKCTKCTDPNTNNVLSTRCTVCFGGGYYAPLPYTYFGQPDQRRTRIGQEGLATAVLKTAQVLAFAAPEAGDIIVHAKTFNRFLIAGDIAIAVELAGVPIAMNIRLEALPSSSAAYDVPVPRWEE